MIVSLGYLLYTVVQHRMDRPLQNSSEEELYFEMAFESKTETGEEDVRDERRGSSVGPILERPKYLRNISKPFEIFVTFFYCLFSMSQA